MITDLITKKAYLSAITVTNISQSFNLQDGRNKSTDIDVEQNYMSVSLAAVKRAECGT